MARVIDQEYDNDCNLIEVTVEDDGEYIHLERVRHGKWENEVEKYPEMYGYIPLSQVVCSVCDRAQEKKTSYCPNCGAKMDGKEIE